MPKIPKDLSDWVYRTSMGDFEIGLFCPRCGEPIPIVVTKPPEVRNEILDSKRRIQSAIDFYNEHFDEDGHPKNIKGIMLYFRYGWFDNWSSKAHKILFWTAARIYRIEMFRNKVTKKLQNLFKRSKKVTGD